jgi:hypothetical protein
MLSDSDLIAQTLLIVRNSRRELDRLQESHSRFMADIERTHAFIVRTQVEEKAAWLKGFGYIPSHGVEREL